MKREEVFLAWAPKDSVWSPWVLPVPFAQMNCLDFAPALEVKADSFPWILQGDKEEIAYILDLPGEQAIRYGLTMAGLGLRPRRGRARHRGLFLRRIEILRGSWDEGALLFLELFAERKGLRELREYPRVRRTENNALGLENCEMGEEFSKDADFRLAVTRKKTPIGGLAFPGARLTGGAGSHTISPGAKIHTILF